MEISTLPHLETLDLNTNRLTGSSRDFFDQDHVRTLFHKKPTKSQEPSHFHYQQIPKKKKELPSGFGKNCKSLKKLILSYNEIREVQLSELEAMSKLTFLDLRENATRWENSNCFSSVVKGEVLVKNHKPDLILEGLYLGSIMDTRSIVTLRELGIKRILSVCSEDVYKHPEILYKKIDLQDDMNQQLLSVLPECFEFIDLINCGNVLVHCVRGISRSASVVIAYMMVHRGMPLKEAHKFVKSKREMIYPNGNFLDQLKKLNA
eukprot:TRINITY_DN2077_c0_g1_i21.p1 TRINITY_DN2077_c0_g1~~TRINITY_DN2077_c0_g1_i21.p1  ORF type:complete len:263 (-),score=46.67 TRINITY_DN2077_c0_g1_i21:72-860(-)